MAAPVYGVVLKGYIPAAAQGSTVLNHIFTFIYPKIWKIINSRRGFSSNLQPLKLILDDDNAGI